ncbi:MAG: lactonase family protein [Ferruginibacter sp.]
MKKIILYFLFCFLSLSSSSQTIEHNNHSRLAIGTYTNGKSKGIYVYDFNSSNGKAVLLDSAITSNPSYLAFSADNKFLYAVNELGATKGSGMVSAFSLQDKHPLLKKINQQPTGGDDPCYISIDKTGRWLVAGNYSGGNFSIFPIDKNNGSIVTSVNTINHQGKSIDTARQTKPHIHCTVFSPDNKYLLVADLGIDKIVSYHFDELTGKVRAAEKNTSVQPGAGPRHLTFHPNGKYIYLTEEMAGNVSVFSYDEGQLSFLQTINALAEPFHGKISAADIHISPDGKFLYSSNRGESNSITIFSIADNGMLTIVDHQSTMGKIPRNFCIDPTGNFLLVANQESDEVVIFKRDTITGKLTDTHNRIFVGSPVCLKWMGL